MRTEKTCEKTLTSRIKWNCLQVYFDLRQFTMDQKKVTKHLLAARNILTSTILNTDILKHSFCGLERCDEMQATLVTLWHNGI